MLKVKQIVLLWLPALSVMLAIFLVSAQPLSNLPNFAWADRVIKKGGHMVGYAFLAVSYWRVLGFQAGEALACLVFCGTLCSDG